MSDWYPRCFNCKWSEPAAAHKSEDERPAVADFVYCGLAKCFMYRFDYCTQHPDIQMEVIKRKYDKKDS